MREFISAVEDIEAEDEREAKIVALVAEGKSREDAEDEVDNGKYVEFKLDDRVLRAYPPSEGQLIFLMASMGRGQSQQNRLASIINVMMETLKDDDKDWFEERLLTGDKKRQLPPKTIEQIFEGLTEEWFSDARPTKPASASA